MTRSGSSEHTSSAHAGDVAVRVSDAPDPGRAALRVRGVRKVFSTPEGTDVAAVDGVDLDVAANEFFVMLGPSGCGKTTLLRLIAGLEQADDGEIWLDEERLDVLPPYRRNVNTVFQSYALFPHLSVAQNIAFGLQMKGAAKAEIADTVQEMLRLVQLSGLADRRPDQLSGGQQQRVALARALARHPQVLLLDEPLAALDLHLRRGMQVELKRLQRATGVTFVFVTHDQEEAMSMGDRIAVFRDGRIAQIGTPEQIYEAPADRFVAQFIGETNLLDGRLAAGVLELADGSRLPVTADGPTGPVTVAIRPERLRIVRDGPLRGTVEEVVYMGTDRRCHVLLGDGTALVVRVPAGSAMPLPAPGEPVALEVDPERVTLLEDDAAC